MAIPTNGVTLAWRHPPYADGRSGINPASLRVSFNRALGNPSAGGRAAGSDITDLFFRKDQDAYIAAPAPPLSFAGGTLVTMTANIADNAGNTRTQTVQFFVAVTSPQPPTASFNASATNGQVPLTVDFNGSSSTDLDGKVMRWEWYFGDGTTALGRMATKTFTAAGTFPVTLLVRDMQGGVNTTTREISVVQFRILSASFSGGNFTLSFPTEPNQNYVVERTGSLSPAAWTELPTVSGDGWMRRVTDSNAVLSQQFYRVRLE